MVYLEGLVQAVKNEDLRQELEERLDIVTHKIKFMDPVPVACCDTDNNINFSLHDALVLAGGMVATDPSSAAYIIYHEAGKDLNALMRNIPAQVAPEWPAVQYNRVLFLNQDDYKTDDAGNRVSLVEDLAEMMHPGSFIFGHEGESWMRFVM